MYNLCKGLLYYSKMDNVSYIYVYKSLLRIVESSTCYLLIIPLAFLEYDFQQFIST